MALALAGAGIMAVAGPAGAGERAARPCAPGEVSAVISEGHSPDPTMSRLFGVWLKGQEGAGCLLTGTLDHIRFYDTAGKPLDVRFSTKTAVAPFQDVLVDDFFRAVVYIWAPAGEGGMPIGGMGDPDRRRRRAPIGTPATPLVTG
ncbi:hypothetical protein [Lentzea sp. NPDC059081]|uniref:hypothetical protein n=1 Tax=Lentzea sp. NPDC059081 TaxID=3346719 RepID=UPI0036A3737A